MPLIALTGGIGSGKSTIARHLASLGAVLVDADVLARRAVEPGTPGLAAIRERFGDDVIAADGSLDRGALGAVVFADSQARHDLNQIVHPAVRALYADAVSAAFAADPDAVVVYDVPLLAEGPAGEFDAVIVVETERETRIRRLVESRGMTVADAEARIAAQASDEERRAIADVVIDNSGTLESTHAQVDAVWRRIADGSLASRG